MWKFDDKTTRNSKYSAKNTELLEIMRKQFRDKVQQNKELVAIIIIFTVLRFVAASFMGLMPQDAYYTYYSNNPALSYFDHPPMVAYMIKLFTMLLGKSAFVLHLADFTVTAATIGILYLFLKRVLSGDTLKRALILIITAPFITVLSINTTPDVPLLFFWALTLLLAHKAITHNGVHWWLLAGISAGLAFDSKYTGIFLPAGLFLFLLLSKEHRKLIFSGRFLLFASAFAIAILPVVIWNVQNDFISLKYQSSERAADITAFQFNPKLFLGYFGSQLALALPLLFLALFPITYKTIKEYLSKKEHLPTNKLFAASFALPMFILFTGIALIYWVKINWLMPVYLSATVLAALYIKADKFIRWQTIFSAAVHLAIVAELIWMPIKVNSDDTWWGWDKLAAKTQSIREQYPDHFIFSDNSYKVSAELNFYLDEHIYAGNVINEKAFQFALDDKDLSHLYGKDAIYVTTSRYQRKQASKGTTVQILSPFFASAQPLDSLILKDSQGEIQRKFYFFECKEYKMPVR